MTLIAGSSIRGACAILASQLHGVGPADSQRRQGAPPPAQPQRGGDPQETGWDWGLWAQ